MTLQKKRQQNEREIITRDTGEAADRRFLGLPSVLGPEAAKSHFP